MCNLGEIIKQRRMAMPMTLRELATISEVSASHLGRIERGERLPSAHILQKIAQPLGFKQNRLFTLAGFLSESQSEDTGEELDYIGSRLDRDVIKVLAKESFIVQRSVIEILSLVKSLAQSSIKKPPDT